MRNRTVGLSLTVGKDGKPTAVKVVKSAGALTDTQVLSSISEYVYKPAMLDGEAIPMDVNLSVTVE
jgi:outer membrane biosynthesis protein TonB